MGRLCEMCPEDAPQAATVFCVADSCYLCPPCDEEVHTANRLASRHIRRPVLEEEVADGSSINDDSEIALVPDVTQQPSDATEISPELSEPDSSADMLFMDLSNPVPLTYEDAAEYDFCDFETGIGSKMPSLCAIEDDAMFGESKAVGKTLNTDFSWESMVHENVEHVVPDVVDIGAVTRVTTGGSIVNRETVEMGTSTSGSRIVSAVSTSAARDLKKKTDKARVRTVVNRSGISVGPAKAAMVKRDSARSSSFEGSLTGKKRSRESTDNLGLEESTDEDSTDKLRTDEMEVEKDAELRKKRRMEALARFRSKRANRSFVKKVRYECRKQLADSRPRVKGRFVRKIEMALYRKYGALYREHLDELKQQKPESKGDQCVPAI